MLDYAERIKPILADLDNEVDLFAPVLVDDHLLPLFKRHSGISEIKLYPVDLDNILGLHIGSSRASVVHIFYQRCSSHWQGELEPGCPACQLARYVLAKELIHTLDRDEDKTSPERLGDDLLEHLLKGDWSGNNQVQADGMAGIWAVELLARYRHRVTVTGNFGSLPPAPKLVESKKTEDFSYYAKQYGIPQGVAHVAFSDRVMSSMRDVRKRTGMPLT